MESQPQNPEFRNNPELFRISFHTKANTPQRLTMNYETCNRKDLLEI